VEKVTNCPTTFKQQVSLLPITFLFEELFFAPSLASFCQKFSHLATVQLEYLMNKNEHRNGMERGAGRTNLF
jgi:hypothetical protein